MLDEILNLIDKKEYVEAEQQLLQIIKGNDEHAIAFGNAVLGELYQRYDFEKNDDELALRYLRRNIFSKYPHPYAYCLYARLEKDKNIAENNLRQGLVRFPNDVRLWKELFFVTSDKDHVISEIEEKKIKNLYLSKKILLYYMEAQNWDKAISYVSQIKAMQDATDSEKMFATLFEGFSLLFCSAPNYAKAQKLFEEIIAWDVTGAFEYSNYLGNCFSLIKQGKRSEAETVLDRIPTNNSICDFLEGPWYDEFYYDFEEIYRVIFREITDFFSDDQVRKEKANVLLSLYLYKPSQDYGLFRYKKSDAAVLTRYLKKGYSKDVAIALYNMRCHFKQFGEAYDAIWELIKHYDNPEASDAFFSDAIEPASETELSELCVRAEQHLSDEDYDVSIFISQIFEPLIEELHDRKMYSCIVQVSKKLTDEEIIESNCAFECAYAMKTCNNIKRAKLLYLGIIKKDPQNSAALNNIGVIYEESGDLQNAMSYFSLANSLNKNDEIYKNNIFRVQKGIRESERKELSEISKNISLNSLDQIGFSVELQARIRNISDSGFRSILLRDIKECAIAIVSHQDKSATVLCGSISESILLSQILDRGIEKYDISKISSSKNATNYPIINMALNELLFVAAEERLIDKSTYHLGHYLRDFRNIIHPAKEIRMTQNVSHESALTMWNVLKQIIFAIIPDEIASTNSEV